MERCAGYTKCKRVAEGKYRFPGGKLEWNLCFKCHKKYAKTAERIP